MTQTAVTEVRPNGAVVPAIDLGVTNPVRLALLMWKLQIRRLRTLA